MTAIDLAGVVSELRRAQSFLVTTHASPDGDAIGSMLATRFLLEAMGKERVTCICHDPVPGIYRWLPGAGEIRTPDDPLEPFELAVIVDVSQRNRIGRVGDRIPAGVRTLVIDHHLENGPCGDLNFVDPTYAATGEIMTELFEVAGVPLSVEAAECAYVALATDTGSFRYSSTTARSHRMAERLMAAGIDVGRISERVFDFMSLAKFRLMAHVLQRTQFACAGRVAYNEVSLREMQDLAAKSEDLDGLVNLARNVEGVEVAMMFKETGPASTKVSMRSNRDFNAALFLQRFGGGGHACAAGATIALSLSEARTSVLNEIEVLLGEQV
ncbi:MAG: bifunctional oligoribonuclease/PAP phosphatase NrnA [FCB group bacterium]|jgi:phosphoesterase RecJ-like protein|nr:bifunctional oligoribonuclease/PAP phosphatase NrnA [FCB group bacterium]